MAISIQYQSSELVELNISNFFAMLNVGTTPLPFEPYTGGKPSPSPEYPQEIHNAGDEGEIDVGVTGAQLFDASDDTLYFNNYYVVKDNKQLTEANNNRGILMQLSPGNYVYSQRAVNTDIQVAAFSQIPENGSVAEWVKTTTPNEVINISFMVMETAPYIFIKYTNINAEVASDETIRGTVMLNAGSTALPFEPYKTPQSLTFSTPDGLPGIPVDSGGNFVDETGQEWLCNYRDWARGVDVKCIETITGRIWGRKSKFQPQTALYNIIYKSESNSFN